MRTADVRAGLETENEPEAGNVSTHAAQSRSRHADLRDRPTSRSGGIDLLERTSEPTICTQGSNRFHGRNAAPFGDGSRARRGPVDGASRHPTAAAPLNDP